MTAANAVVTLAGLVVLLSHAVGVVQSTHDLTVGDARTRGDAARRVLVCLENTVEKLLPQGTRVAVHPGQVDDTWPLPITQFAFPRYEVVTPSRASYYLAVGTPSYAACGGHTAGVFPAP